MKLRRLHEGLDDERRNLERQAATGDPAAAARLRRVMQRVGLAPTKLEEKRWVGQPKLLAGIIKILGIPGEPTERNNYFFEATLQQDPPFEESRQKLSAVFHEISHGTVRPYGRSSRLEWQVSFQTRPLTNQYVPFIEVASSEHNYHALKQHIMDGDDPDDSRRRGFVGTIQFIPDTYSPRRAGGTLRVDTYPPAVDWNPFEYS